MFTVGYLNSKGGKLEAPRVKKNLRKIYLYRANYKIVGNTISFTIIQNNILKYIDVVREFSGRMLQDVLDIEQIMSCETDREIPPTTEIYEFVAFKF